MPSRRREPEEGCPEVACAAVYRRILLGTGGSTSAMTGMSWFLLGPVPNLVGHHTRRPPLIVHTT